MRFHSRTAFLRNAMITVGVLFLLSSCSAIERLPNRDHSFRLMIIDQDMSLEFWQLTESTEIPETLLAQAFTSQNAAVIAETDIEFYNWTEQSLALTDEATDDLASSLGCSVPDIQHCDSTLD